MSNTMATSSIFVSDVHREHTDSAARFDPPPEQRTGGWSERVCVCVCSGNAPESIIRNMGSLTQLQDVLFVLGGTTSLSYPALPIISLSLFCMPQHRYVSISLNV